MVPSLFTRSCTNAELHVYFLENAEKALPLEIEKYRPERYCSPGSCVKLAWGARSGLKLHSHHLLPTVFTGLTGLGSRSD